MHISDFSMALASLSRLAVANLALLEKGSSIANQLLKPLALKRQYGQAVYDPVPVCLASDEHKNLEKQLRRGLNESGLCPLYPSAVYTLHPS